MGVSSDDLIPLFKETSLLIVAALRGAVVVRKEKLREKGERERVREIQLRAGGTIICEDNTCS